MFFVPGLRLFHKEPQIQQTHSGAVYRKQWTLRSTPTTGAYRDTANAVTGTRGEHKSWIGEVWAICEFLWYHYFIIELRNGNRGKNLSLLSSATIKKFIYSFNPVGLHLSRYCLHQLIDYWMLSWSYWCYTKYTWPASKIVLGGKRSVQNRFTESYFTINIMLKLVRAPPSPKSRYPANAGQVIKTRKK